MNSFEMNIANFNSYVYFMVGLCLVIAITFGGLEALKRIENQKQIAIEKQRREFLRIQAIRAKVEATNKRRCLAEEKRILREKQVDIKVMREESKYAESNN